MSFGLANVVLKEIRNIFKGTRMVHGSHVDSRKLYQQKFGHNVY